jgi:hypothetical protein
MRLSDDGGETRRRSVTTVVANVVVTIPMFDRVEFSIGVLNSRPDPFGGFHRHQAALPSLRRVLEAIDPNQCLVPVCPVQRVHAPLAG